MLKNASQLINQTSGKTEYFTKLEIIEAAKMVMGRIDLDPASCFAANYRHGFTVAEYFFSKEDDGLTKDWFGNVWLNHPFSRADNPRWINKLMQEWKTKHIDQACCITFAATSEDWFQPLTKFPQCYLVPRTNYLLPDGTETTDVTKGSVVTYLGHAFHYFAEIFRPLGNVYLPYSFLYETRSSYATLSERG